VSIVNGLNNVCDPSNLRSHDYGRPGYEHYLKGGSKLHFWIMIFSSFKYLSSNHENERYYQHRNCITLGCIDYFTVRLQTQKHQAKPMSRKTWTRPSQLFMLFAPTLLM
jgi:hypothetical protein